MKLGDFMAGRTPNPDHSGFSNADDMVLAVGLGSAAAEPNDYTAAVVGITEASGALDAQTQDANYLYTGPVSIKTGTSRTFTVSGDRCHGDEFQDALLSHAVKYGTGQAVIKPYVYFGMLTGKGEKGEVSIAVEEDLSGAAGERASFSAALTSVGKPTEYTYVPKA